MQTTTPRGTEVAPGRALQKNLTLAFLPHRRAAKILIGVSVIGLAAAGCVADSIDVRGSGGADTKDAQSCDNRTVDGTCAELGDNFQSDVAAVCDGVVIDGACPSEGRVGICDLGELGRNLHYEPVYDRTSAEDDCREMGGLFIDP